MTRGDVDAVFDVSGTEWIQDGPERSGDRGRDLRFHVGEGMEDMKRRKETETDVRPSVGPAAQHI